MQHSDTSVPPHLHVCLLGDFRLTYDERLVGGLDSPRLQSLLAYLLFHRHAPEPRQRLAFLLYPDSTEAQARTNLRNLLHWLRRALPEADRFLSAGTHSVHWRTDAPFTFDVAQFESALAQGHSVPALVAAIQQYRGDLLPTCYDDWIVPERERLQQAFVDALVRVSVLLEQQHDYGSAIRYTERLLRYDPLREETYRELMRLHALSGDRADALRVFQTCTTVLRRDLDIEPSPETRATLEQYMQSQPSPAAALAKSKTNNLPAPLNTFIGREREIGELRRQLTSTRLLTLTGSGGAGKTRLALALASERIAQYANGVWLIDFAPLSDAGLAPQTVAEVLGVREQPNQTIMKTLADYLADRDLLLVFDNCEHLIQACAQLALTLLQVAPHVQILATSREPLNLPGERTWRVPSLTLPPVQVEADAAAGHWQALAQCESVQLFVERAVTTLPTFNLTSENSATVAHVCQALDGIPLAIELAATRLKVLSVEQIAARLDDRFNLLRGSARTALPRHQTLRATMDWSHSLLSETERILFRRLSVFAGGFTVESMEAICTDTAVMLAQVLELLSSLVDKSLVAVQPLPGAARYYLPETIRQYAAEKLAASGEQDPLRDRHLAVFLKLAAETEPKLRGAAQMLWLARLQRDHDNLRAALAWSLPVMVGTEVGAHAVDASLRLSSALSHFWEVRGNYTEGRSWIERALEADAGTGHTQLLPAPTLRAKALCGVGNLAWYQGDYAGAGRLLEAGLTIYRESADGNGMARALCGLGYVAFWQGNHDLASERCQEGLALARGLNDRQGMADLLACLAAVNIGRGALEAARQFNDESLMLYRALGDTRGTALSLQNLGIGAAIAGNFQAAHEQLQESLLLFRELDDAWSVARAYWGLANVAHAEGDLTGAESYYAQSMLITRDLGSKGGSCYNLEDLGHVAADRGQADRAARLMGAAQALGEALGFPLPLHEQAAHDRSVASARLALGEIGFERAWAAGRALSLQQAIEFALETHGP